MRLFFQISIFLFLGLTNLKSNIIDFKEYFKEVSKLDNKGRYEIGTLVVPVASVAVPVAGQVSKVGRVKGVLKRIKGLAKTKKKELFEEIVKKSGRLVGGLDDLVSWASKNGLGNLTKAELDNILKFVDDDFDFAKRVALSTKEIKSANTLTELANKLNLPVSPIAKSLTPYQARVWYSWRKAKISDMLDKTQTLENQAKQAVNLRNEIRNTARQVMKDTDIADFLDGKEPNKNWNQLVQEKIDKGFKGDNIYQEIINSSMKGRPNVDEVFKIPTAK